MERDEKTHTQTLDGASKVFQKGWETDWETQRRKGLTGRSTELDNLNPRRLNHQPESEHRLDLSPLTTSSRWTACSSSGFPNNWSTGCPWSCFLPKYFLSLNGLPCLPSVGEDAPRPTEGGMVEWSDDSVKGNWERKKGLILECKVNE